MNQHIEHMQRPAKWSYPYLPIKRDKEYEVNIGILTSAHPHVFFVNMFQADDITDFKTVKGKVYSSHMDLYKDGWRVD